MLYDANREEDNSMNTSLIEVDDRGRTSSLKSLEVKPGSKYLVTGLEDGTLLFEPAEIVTRHELALLRNKELVDQIEQTRLDPSKLVESKSRRPRK